MGTHWLNKCWVWLMESRYQARTSLFAFRRKSTVGSILEGFLQEMDFEPDPRGRRGQWEAVGRRRGKRDMPTTSCHPTW